MAELGDILRFPLSHVYVIRASHCQLAVYHAKFHVMLPMLKRYRSVRDTKR